VCWREAICAIIPKPNKIDYKTPKVYRPIALLNCLGKIIEKILANRLSYYAEKHSLLHEEQMGGRKQRSAVDTALRLTHEIQKARSKGYVSLCLMLDVKGAFDNVSKERLLNTMKNLGVLRNIIDWTESFTTNRRVVLSFDNERDDMKPIDTGIPQGSPISPILFLLYLRPLFDNVKRQYSLILCLSYIDNVLILVLNKKTAQNTRMLEDIVYTAFR